MSEIEKRWRRTGLLVGIEGIDAELLADNLNQCSQLLVNEANEAADFPNLRGATVNFKAGTLLPIIVRLFRAGIRILNIGMLYNDYSQYMRVNIWQGVNEKNFIENYLEYITTDDRVDAFFL